MKSSINSVYEQEKSDLINFYFNSKNFLINTIIKIFSIW